MCVEEIWAQWTYCQETSLRYQFYNTWVLWHGLLSCWKQPSEHGTLLQLRHVHSCSKSHIMKCLPFPSNTLQSSCSGCIHSCDFLVHVDMIAKRSLEFLDRSLHSLFVKSVLSRSSMNEILSWFWCESRTQTLVWSTDCECKLNKQQLIGAQVK